MSTRTDNERPWYTGVTPYQWLVLLIASLGWVFDIFEGQIFVTSMNEAMPSLLPAGATAGDKEFYNKIALASFLVGGSLGGVLFGALSDRIGRTRTMILTILVYSVFTCVTAFSQSPWQMIALRFLVAMGVGGEWAVASAMVAEVFPKQARARSLGIFHATSSFGTFLAIAAGAWIVGNPKLGWRWGFAVGAVPALLTLWIRWKLKEPERWVEARQKALEDRSQRTGRIVELFSRGLRRKTLVGVSLATIGLATFWGVRIYGKDLMRSTAERPYVAALPECLTEDGKPKKPVLDGDLEAVLALFPGDMIEGEKLAALEQTFKTLRPSERLFPAGASDQDKRAAIRRQLDEAFESIKRTEMIGHFLVTVGGFLGLLSFGPICERIGRRGAFLFFHLAGFVSGVGLFAGIPGASAPVLWFALPVFGYLTLGMHAGYAIYFPELFPTRLRGTGGGFCFNVGRLTAAPILVISGWMQKGVSFRVRLDWLPDGIGWRELVFETQPISLAHSAAILSFLFLLGVVVLLFAPETKGQELPE